jgi:hypothetical protein
MVGFSPVATTVEVIYDTGSLMLSMCTLEYLISFIPLNFVAIACLDKRGLRFTIVLAAALTLTGAWLRQII